MLSCVTWNLRYLPTNRSRFNSFSVVNIVLTLLFFLISTDFELSRYSSWLILIPFLFWVAYNTGNKIDFFSTSEAMLDHRCFLDTMLDQRCFLEHHYFHYHLHLCNHCLSLTFIITSSFNFTFFSITFFTLHFLIDQYWYSPVSV